MLSYFLSRKNKGLAIRILKLFFGRITVNFNLICPFPFIRRIVVWCGAVLCVVDIDIENLIFAILFQFI
jgi:hypothetical protein